MNERHQRHLLDLVGAMYTCLREKQILPCLMLLYSGIEVVAKMASKPGESTRSFFTRWVDRYILPQQHFNVTALDLYAARCGVLHSFSPDSGLYQDGKARRISYSWGNAKLEDLEKVATAVSMDGVCVHLDDLVGAFVSGLAEYFEAIDGDDESSARSEEVRARWFSSIDSTLIEEIAKTLPRKND